MFKADRIRNTEVRCNSERIIYNTIRIMKRIILILTILFSIGNLHAQDYQFRPNINKDSLLNASLKDLPEEMRKEYLKTYKKCNKQTKEFLLLMISMPKSSKRDLVKDYEDKKNEIDELKEEYSKLAPKNHIVDVEFEAESKILTVPEQITIKIYELNDSDNKDLDKEPVKRSTKRKVISQNWNLENGSKELEEVLKSIGWTNKTLAKIKFLLEKANCISIENGKTTTIGFARSGLGKYSYKIFDKDLDLKQKEEFNNGCSYIYYKNNIVLEYGGGAVGSQCFEKD